MNIGMLMVIVGLIGLGLMMSIIVIKLSIKIVRWLT